MSDTRLRRVERAFRASGDVEDHAALLQEQVRCGDLAEQRLFLAAMCQHPAAMLVRPDVFPVTRWDQRLDYLAEADLTMPVRICLAACRHIYPMWNLEQRPEYATGWVRRNEGRAEYTIDEPTRSIRARVDVGDYHVVSSVPMQEYRDNYPNFDGHPVWDALVAAIRKRMQEDGNIIHECLYIPNGFNVVEEFLSGNESRFWVQNFFDTFERPSNFHHVWFNALLRMCWTDIQRNFIRCLQSCYEFGVEDVTTAINKEVSRWALT